MTTGEPVTSGEPAVDQFDPSTRTALARLLLAMADDEFVLGYWDSEWTGIAPMLEEDVAEATRRLLADPLTAGGH